MPIEIERKFLVHADLLTLEGSKSQALIQGYLQDDNGFTTRVRVVDGTIAYLTLKGPRLGKHGCPEFEYSIPLTDGYELLDRCGTRIVRKDRYELLYGRHVWHVDLYKGNLEGLLSAEVELKHEAEKFSRPLWLSFEVTADRQFKNKALARNQAVPALARELAASRLAALGMEWPVSRKASLIVGLGRLTPIACASARRGSNSKR
jgi:CYTH domain-containing protein